MTGAIVPPTIAMPPRSASALAEAMVETTTQATVLRRWGIIAAINANGTVDVLVGGNLIPNLKRNASYQPTVGERVLLDAVGTDMTVIGATGPSPRNFNRPTGDIEPSLRKTAKPDTLLLQGQTVKRTDYPKLFQWVTDQGLLTTAQAPNNLFGAGDGSTTFTLPDFRGRTVVGGSTALPVGSQFGADNVALQAANMPQHTHTVGDHAGHTHPLTITGGDHFHRSSFNTGSGGDHNHSLYQGVPGGGTMSNAGSHGNHPAYQIIVAAGGGVNDSWAGPPQTHTGHTHGLGIDVRSNPVGGHTHSVVGDTSTVGHTHTGTAGAQAAQTHTVAAAGNVTPTNVDVRQNSYAVNWLIWI